MIEESRIEFKGFNRILVNEHGEAWSVQRAHAAGIFADVGFMREDGWSLGAPRSLAYVAESLWKSDWVYKIERSQAFWERIK